MPGRTHLYTDAAIPNYLRCGSVLKIVNDQPSLQGELSRGRLNPNEKYYRVFAFGLGHAASISGTLSRAVGDNLRDEWQESMPYGHIVIEHVDADGLAVRTEDKSNEY